jgi:WD40 repeat protein
VKTLRLDRFRGKINLRVVSAEREMASAFWKTVIACLVWVGASHSVFAQERYALLFGNQKYSAKIGVLTNPGNDVMAVKDALLSAGFKKENIEVVLNADLGALNKARREFQQRLRGAGEGALGFFYYSGHGAASKVNDGVKASNYLIPIDVEDSRGARGIFESSLPLNNVVRELRDAAPFADLVVVFDACRNELRLNVRSVDLKTFVAESLPANGYTFLGFSTDTSSVAYDGGEGAGPFAKALAEELVRPDQHHEQVFFNVKVAVIQATQSKKPPQKPSYLDGFDTKRLYFVTKPVPVDVQELTFWNDTIALNSVEAYKTFIRQYSGSSRVREAMRRQFERQEEMDWNVARSENNRDALEDFLTKHPNGRFSDDARDQIAALARAEEDRDWRKAKNSKSAEAVVEFLRKYPATTRYSEARDLVRQLEQATTEARDRNGAESLAWSEAQELDTAAAYSKYLALFPDRPNAALAQQRVAVLTELKDWQEARDARLLGGLQKFVQKYPEGPHASEARELIASLMVAAEPTSGLTQVALQTKGISEELLKQQKRLELRNLFFPQGTFSNFLRGKISDRIDLRKAQPIRRLLLTNDLTRLYSGGDDGAVRIWDLNGVQRTHTLSPVHSGRIYAVARSDTSRYMATGAWDRRVFLWDSQTNGIHSTIRVRPVIYSMTFSPTGRWVAAAGSEGQVDFIRVKDQRIVNRRHISPASTIFALAYLPNKSEDLVVGDASGALRLWSVVRGREKYVQGAHSDKILALTIHPKGSLVASAGLDGSVKLWSNTLSKVAEIGQAHLRYVTALRFTSDGRYLATGGADALIRIWDVKTLKRIGRPFAGHNGDIEDIEFSPDGKYMFTSSEDRTVRIWDVSEGKLLYTMVAFPNGGYVIFDQEQRYLASENVQAILKKD